MASLSPSLPSAKIVARKLRSTISASSAASRSNASYGKGDGGILQRSLMSADTTRPWWAPLFRGVTDPISEDPATETVEKPKSTGKRSGLTAEKARLLRKELRATETWHDPMYHSAIAARLASPDEKW